MNPIKPFLDETNSLFLSSIKLFVFDVDGVLTDGNLYYNETGEIVKVFSVKDGLGIKRLLSISKVALLSGNPSLITERRAKDLGITLYKVGCKDKRDTLSQWKQMLNLDRKEILFVGDDLNDLLLRDHVGYFLCPMDAVSEIIEISDFMIPKKGGKGAIRLLSNLFFFHSKSKTFSPGIW